MDLEEPPPHGRPTVPANIRTLIRTMAQTNPRWGAPRIHGEPSSLPSLRASKNVRADISITNSHNE